MANGRMPVPAMLPKPRSKIVMTNCVVEGCAAAVVGGSLDIEINGGSYNTGHEPFQVHNGRITLNESLVQGVRVPYAEALHGQDSSMRWDVHTHSDGGVFVAAERTGRLDKATSERLAVGLMAGAYALVTGRPWTGELAADDEEFPDGFLVSEAALGVPVEVRVVDDELVGILGKEGFVQTPYDLGRLYDVIRSAIADKGAKYGAAEKRGCVLALFTHVPFGRATVEYLQSALFSAHGFAAVWVCGPESGAFRLRCVREDP